MSAWWYAVKNKKIGPIHADELMRLFQRGRINEETMLWKEGMESWQSLGDIGELRPLQASLPPPLPTMIVADPDSFLAATHWPRFFARFFDLWWEGLTVWFVFFIGVLLSLYPDGFFDWLRESGSAELLAILSVPVALVLDALVYRLFGNTPGKAWLGLRVRTQDGKGLSFAHYIGRNLSVWARGLALGIPLLNLYTMAKQALRLTKGKPASYDEGTNDSVCARRVGLVRRISFGFGFVGLLVIALILRGVEASQNTEFQRSAVRDLFLNDPAIAKCRDASLAGSKDRSLEAFLAAQLECERIASSDVR